MIRIIALVLFAMALPAHAATIVDDQRRLDVLTAACRGASSETDEACLAVEKLADKLKARGYCVYGHGVIGRARGSHCYEIKEISSGKYLDKPWTEERCLQTKTDCDLMPDGSIRPRTFHEGPEGDQ